MNCKKDCKWIGYNYKTDENGHILKATSRLCLKYKKPIVNGRIKECIDGGEHEWMKHKKTIC